MSSVNVRINEAINRRGMTGTELAKRLGVNVSTVSKWRNGPYIPRLMDFRALCEALEVSADHLLGLPASEAINRAMKEPRRVVERLERDLSSLKGLLDQHAEPTAQDEIIAFGRELTKKAKDALRKRELGS